MARWVGNPDRLRISLDITNHAEANPAAVRRVLGRLRIALARQSESIILADVYLALDESLIATDGDQQASTCSVDYALQRCVLSVMDQIEQSLIQHRGKTTLSEVRGN